MLNDKKGLLYYETVNDAAFEKPDATEYVRVSRRQTNRPPSHFLQQSHISNSRGPPYSESMQYKMGAISLEILPFLLCFNDGLQNIFFLLIWEFLLICTYFCVWTVSLCTCIFRNKKDHTTGIQFGATLHGTVKYFIDFVIHGAS